MEDIKSNKGTRVMYLKKCITLTTSTKLQCMGTNTIYWTKVFNKGKETIQEFIKTVKLWFTNLYFVGFYSVPNLIVIIFNLMYPVFIVGCDCKGCVLERESVKTQASEARRLLVGVLRLSFPRSEACALHMTGMWRVSTDGDSCVSWVSRG